MLVRIKELWMKALRSGEYTQGDGQLMCGTDEKPEYCCLGVLCELHRKEHHDKVWEHTRYLNRHAYLPPEVAEWAGLCEDVLVDKGKDDIDGGYDLRLGGCDTAATLNDENLSIESIADKIETHVRPHQYQSNYASRKAKEQIS